MGNKGLEITVRVLGYVDAGQYVAHCLEFDILGVGRTFQLAQDTLVEAIAAQVTFAMQQDDMTLLWNPAPHQFFAAFDTALQTAIFSGRDRIDPTSDNIATTMSMPPLQTGSAFQTANA